MIFTNMAYPGKNYRVQVFDAWLGETFEPMDNPQDGDKIVKRELGSDGQPVVSEELVYSGGEWVDEGGGGSSLTVIYDGDITTTEFEGQYGGEVTPDTPIPYDFDAPREGLPEAITVVFNGTTYSNVPWDADYTQYGSSDFSEYPFVIGFFSESEEVYEHLWLMTESAGTFAVKVSADIGGGSSVTVEELDVTENGTYTAPSGTAYSPVVVNVSSGGVTPGSSDSIRLTNTGISTDIVVKYIEADDLNRDGEHTGIYKIKEKRENMSGNMWTVYKNGYNISSTVSDPYPCFTLQVSNAYSLEPDNVGDGNLCLMKDDGTYKYYACLKQGDYAFHITQP